MSQQSPSTTSDVADISYLTKFIYLSIATALATVLIKGAAAFMTKSAGLMSDALESTVNLIAAVVALWALKVSAKPADDEHEFGHGKAEYFSSAVEGALIFIAAGGIIAGAILKLLHPVPLEELGLGLVLSVGASVLNLGTGAALIHAGRKHRSIVLEADGKHLMTDVITSAGVVVAMGLIWIAARFGLNWEILDPIIAIAVGINILWTGYSLLKRSVVGLLDAALPEEEVTQIHDVISSVMGGDNCPCRVTHLRTRESGRQRFIEAIVEVPGDWSVERSHDLTDRLEIEIEKTLPGIEAILHVEPLGSGTVAAPLPPRLSPQSPSECGV